MMLCNAAEEVEEPEIMVDDQYVSFCANVHLIRIGEHGCCCVVVGREEEEDHLD